MPYLILGLTLLVTSVLLLRWFVTADPKAVLGVLKWVLALVGLALVLLVVLGGARQLMILAIPMLLPFLLRIWSVWQRFRAVSSPPPGQKSHIETRYLRMTLDHDSGAMAGTVLDGPFRGSHLDELDEEQLLTLWRDCRTEDAQSAAVLEAYLDRHYGQAWRDSVGAPGGAGGQTGGQAGGQAGAQAGANPGGTDFSGNSRMNRDEAYEILGLAPGASPKEIRAAHRRLMQQMHPDHGGSNYLAAKINHAKDLLLKT